MAAFKCSRCGSLVTVEEGETEVVCPGCRGRARLPILAPDLYRPPLPSVVVNRPARKPMPSHGWFTRSFALTSGGCAGIALCLLASCTGLLFMARDFGWETTADEYRNGAIEQVLPRLAELKINQLENGAVVRRKDGKVILTANGLDKESRLHPVAAEWTVSDFGAKRIWQLETLMVDDKLVFSRELGSGQPTDL